MPPLTKAFVWAAGLGTRLRPYTHDVPKPLIPLFGTPLIAYILRFLGFAGIQSVTVNTWHLAEQFERLPELGAEIGLDVALSRQPDRFEHAGDLAFARTFLDALDAHERFVALNGDTLVCFNPALLHEAASLVSRDAPALIITHEAAANPLAVDANRLVGIGELAYYDDATPDSHWDDFGIKVFHASIREHLPLEPGPMSFHGRNGLVGRLVAAGKQVLILPLTEGDRAEVGTAAEYEAHESDERLRALADRLMSLPQGVA